MIKFKSYYLLLISMLVFLGIIFFISKDDVFSVNIHDTYFVMSATDFYKATAILTFTSGLVYFILDKSKVRLISILSKIHIFGTLFLIVALIFFNYKNNLGFQSVKFEDLINQIDYGFYVIISLMLILFLQFLFLINIFVAQIKKLRSYRIS